MRFEVLHGNINEVYRDLPVENNEAPFRVRRFIGDAFGKIGFNPDEKPGQSLSGYAPIIMGKIYLFQMLASEQTGTKLPSGYFHALITETIPRDFVGDFSNMWNIQFASQEDLLAAAEGTIFHVREETTNSLLDLSIHPEVMKEIFYACLNRWSVNRNPVIILVPEDQPFMDYTKTILKEIYSYFPAALRAVSGFVSAPREGYEPERGISLIFLPDNEKNAAKPNALRIQESFGYFSTLFDPELESFVRYTLNLKPDERASWLEELFNQVEGGGDLELFREVKAQDYVAYYTARVAWPNLPKKELLELFSQQLQQPLAPAMYKQMENLLAVRFPHGEINRWAVQAAKQTQSVEQIIALANEFNQLGAKFPVLEWQKEILLETIAGMLLQQCHGDEYQQYHEFVQHREPLANCFGSVTVQDMIQKLQQRKDELVEEQYQALVEIMQEDPEKAQLDRCYPENKTRCSRRLAEISNIQFHRMIKNFSLESVDELFTHLKEKVDQCQAMAEEPAVQDMQACYDAYWGLWQAAQSQEARNLTAYFRLLAQIAQIPSPKLRPAMLVQLRQWLNEVELLDYLNAYEQFCHEKPELTVRLRDTLNEMIEKDFQILSRHPLHMTITNHTGIRKLFEQCSVYSGQLESCGLQNVRAEILLQFNSPLLIENYLLSVQELMAITQFILLNATSPLPRMPKEKLKELLLAFAAIGVFKAVHFEPLLKISESRDYHRKLWKYCMAQAGNSLNEQVRIAEIYERCLGTIEARRQLEQWYRMGAVTPELYRRLSEIGEDDDETTFRRRTTPNADLRVERVAKEGQFDFDLRRVENSEKWEKPNDSLGFMFEINQISQEIQEEQERAQRVTQWEYQEETEKQKRKKQKYIKKKRQGRLKRSLIIATVVLAAALLIVQLYKYFTPAN